MEIEEIYPEDSNRFYEYKKDVDGNELYDYTLDTKHFFKNKDVADDSWDDQYYAKKADGTEYIPDNKLIPFQQGYPAYPLTKDEDDIYFPKNNDGDEMWLYKTKTGTVLHSGGILNIMVQKYPKNKSGREIYPIFPNVDTDDQGNDVFSFFESHIAAAGLKYARDDKNFFYYPLDAGGNEYIIDKKDYVNQIQNFVDYPVSVKGTIIIPNINGIPYFVSHFKTQVSINDITGQIVKVYYPNIGNDKDFETNVTPVVQLQQQQQRRQLDGKYFYVLSKEKNVLHDTLNFENITTTTTTTTTTDILMNENIPQVNVKKNNNNNNNIPTSTPTSSNKNLNANINFFNKIKSPIIIMFVICLIVILLLMVWGYLKYFFK